MEWGQHLHTLGWSMRPAVHDSDSKVADSLLNWTSTCKPNPAILAARDVRAETPEGGFIVQLLATLDDNRPAGH